MYVDPLGMTMRGPVLPHNHASELCTAVLMQRLLWPRHVRAGVAMRKSHLWAQERSTAAVIRLGSGNFKPISSHSNKGVAVVTIVIATRFAPAVLAISHAKLRFCSSHLQPTS